MKGEDARGLTACEHGLNDRWGGGRDDGIDKCGLHFLEI